MPLQFLHIIGGRKGQIDEVIDLMSGSRILIGRDQEVCAVWVGAEDLDVGRKHAQVTQEAQGLWIEDLGSANGTFLNGVRLEGRAALSPGMVIGLGRAVALAVSEPSKVVRKEPPPIKPRLGRRQLGSLVVIGVLLFTIVGSGIVFLRSREARLARSRAMVDSMTALLAAPPPASPDDVGELSPEARASIGDARAAAAAAPAPDPFHDLLAAHIQRVLEDLSDGQVSTVDRLLRDEVARELVSVLPHRQQDGKWTGKGAYCRAPTLRPELEALLKDALGGNARRAKWISYIPWIESAYWPDPPPAPAGERGLWQFIPKTAQRYGLLKEDRDDRCGRRAATYAAAKLFNDNFEECTARFPLLAVAAFNTGAHNACKLAHDASIPEDRRDILGFIEKGKLHPVTHDYIPKWLAASFIGEHPEDALLIALEYEPDIGSLPECSARDRVVPNDNPC